MKRVTPCRRRRVGGAEWDPGGAELSLRGVRDAATSAEIASAAPRNDNEGGSVTGPAPSPQNRFSCLAFWRRLFGSFLGLPFFLGSRRTGSSSSASCFRANGLAPDTCNRVSKSPDVITVQPWTRAKLVISRSDETTAQSEPYFSASRLTTASACSPCRE